MRRVIFAVGFALVVFACNDENSGTGSGLSEDKTPPGAIPNLAILGEVDSNCTLTWTAPGDDGYDGQAKAYNIRYSTDSARLTSWNNATPTSTSPTPKPAGSTEQFTIHGLSVDSAYLFAIRTIDEKGNQSPMSNVVAAATSPIPSVAIISPTDFDTVDDYVPIDVIAVDDKGVTKVEVFVDTILIGTDLVAPYQVMWDAHTLADKTSHVIFARATDTDNNKSGSKTITCTVDYSKFPPVALSVTSVLDISDSSAKVFWSSDKTDDDFGHYTIYVLKHPDSGGRFYDLSGPANDSSLVISGLLESAVCKVNVNVYDRFNHVTAGPMSYFTTLNRPPKKSSVGVSSTSYGSVAIKWSQNADNDFKRYELWKSAAAPAEQSGAMIQQFDSRYLTSYIDGYAGFDVRQFYSIVTIDTIGTKSASASVAFGWKSRPDSTAGYALQFSGTHFATIPANPVFDLSSSLSIEAWVKSDVGGEVVHKQPAVGYSPYSLSDMGTYVATYLCQGSYSQYFESDHGVKIPGDWNHLAMTFDRGLLCFYVNGNLQHSDSVSQPLCSMNTIISIGRGTPFNGRYFNGIIDEVRIWNVARTAEQVWENFDKVLVLPQTGLVGYWRFDEGSGDSISALVGPNGVLGSAFGADANDPQWVRSTAPIRYRW